ncbi:selenocysteine-specific translation elongation factor [Aureimonas psammosilenae]|uniref:selenocysteine-specific translation elongation factor n=1 Tax=Aureimonas psammosilenae TaxID=2495496 RepID=UPI001260579A|nr:selenocysteine-specific translation elongation factor [Aureimonas psammosilenae]
MIVGTAGHIDHGKTALVKALTGVDADRLKEEKQRGITIDLGFAYQDLGAGVTGFVDVPGHERFVHTMLAGASGIDFALIVVATDDGVMPQTREHLAILDLLGLSRGLVALTKADLAGSERRAEATSEINALLADTPFRDAPVVPVSTLTGEGVETLRDLLAKAEQEVSRPTAAGRFRLSVDRSFTLQGSGTVVTGTVLSGAVSVGDQVLVSPSGLSARVRSIHAQNRAAETGIAGQRCALNLVGEAISKDALHRGDTVLDPALHAPTERIDAELRLLPSETKPLGIWASVRFHHASAERGARIVPLEGDVEPGQSALVQIVLDRPIAAAVLDRFVIRDVSGQRTVGGGRLLDLRPPARKRRAPERLAQLSALSQPDPEKRLAALLAHAPFHVDLDAFGRDAALGPEAVQALAESLVVLNHGARRFALSPIVHERFRESLLSEIGRFHEENAELQGIGREPLRLRTEPRLPALAFASVLAREAAMGTIALEGGFVRLATHEVRLSEADEALYAQIAERLGQDARFRPPRVRDLGNELARDEAEIRRVLKLCARLGRVDQIAHDHFFLRPVTAEMVALAGDAAMDGEDGWFTAAAFRDRVNNGRKVAIEILDFFDRHGVTLRRKDLRRMNPHRLDLF